MKNLKSENMQKEHFSVLANAPIRSQIIKVFFAWDGKGALTPVTKILRTFLRTAYYSGPGNEAVGRLCASMSACLYPYNNF